MKKAYVFYFSDRTGLVVVASYLHEAFSKLPEDKLDLVIKVDVIPFECI